MMIKHPERDNVQYGVTRWMGCRKSGFRNGGGRIMSYESPYCKLQQKGPVRND